MVVVLGVWEGGSKIDGKPSASFLNRTNFIVGGPVRLRGELAKVPGITLYMQAAQHITVGGRLSKTQYQYTLSDADQHELNHWWPIFLEKIKQVPQVTDVTTDRENAGPRLNATVKRDVASTFGILPSMIDNTLDDAFGQRIVSTMFTPLNQYHVVLEVNPRFQTGPEAFFGYLVVFCANAFQIRRPGFVVVFV